MANTADLVASTVLDKAASLMNDTAEVTYGYSVTLPYLQIAMQELQEEFQLNSIPSSENTSAIVAMLAGQTEIIFDGGSNPSLPDDLIEPKQLWERNTGIDPFIPMTKRDFLPHYLEGAPTTTFTYWVWQDQKIKFLVSTADNDVKIDYVKTLFPDLVDENSLIGIINARTFLEFRTAGLCAEFIERNITSADALNGQGVLALQRAMGIGVKGKQAIQTRRRPFRSSYKRARGSYR